ncbi:MAG TPA: hypothetical protein VGK73_05645, partial [Polyangiaceae bacterium]
MAGALGSGCGGDEFQGAKSSAGSAGQSGSAGTDAGSAGDGTGSTAAGAGGDEGRPECTEGDTRECVGPSACRGGQSCERGAWTPCDCGSSGSGGSGAGSSGGSGGTVGEAGAGGELAGAGGALEPGSAGAGGAGGEPTNPSGGSGGGSVKPVCSKATGSFTIEAGVHIWDGETITIANGWTDPVVFEFDHNSILEDQEHFPIPFTLEDDAL